MRLIVIKLNIRDKIIKGNIHTNTKSQNQVILQNIIKK